MVSIAIGRDLPNVFQRLRVCREIIEKPLGPEKQFPKNQQRFPTEQFPDEKTINP
jgi:hypothetical protein